MKKCFILLVTSFTFLVTSANSQSSWFWLNPLPQGNDLNAIKFADSQNGIAVGNLGTILKSTNGGSNWNLIYTGFQSSFYSLAFIDVNTGFIAGADGLILKTTNKGDSWDQIPSGTTDSLNSIIFIDANTGYIAGRNGKILKTTDSGNNWIEQNSGLSSDLNCIYFLNSNTGYACGNAGKVIRTTNAGNNWNIILGNSVNQIFKTVDFLNENKGFVGGSENGLSVLVRTTNGGNSWNSFYIIPGMFINSIQFINQLTGYLCSSVNSIYKTTNGGINWDPYLVNSNFKGFNDISFSDENNGFIAGITGAIAKTQNGGINWNACVPISMKSNARSISFPSNDTGYMTRYDSSGVYKTTNGGHTWAHINNLTQEPIYEIDFLNNLTGYLRIHIGVFGHDLYKTTNGGIIWNLLPYPSDYIDSWKFIDVNTGFASGYNNGYILYRTTNGGINWTPSLNGNLPFGVINFITPNIGFSIDYGSSQIKKTTNNGTSWDYLCSAVIDSAKYIIGERSYFINEEICFGATVIPRPSPESDHYFVYKTTNAGTNWQRKYSLDTIEIKSPYNFINDNSGFFIIEGGIILKTTDQGETWSEVKISDKEINAADFVDEYTGYIAGNDGFIKKTTNGGLIAIENVSSSIPDNFMLGQNYPNPFNPRTKINYELPIMNYVSLKVYDVLGKGVITLVNEKQNAGSYEVVFNGNNLPSGIYFYELRAGDFIETRKMVLLK